jgi:ribosomal protein S18 acetylase RimI-like enzyme
MSNALTFRPIAEADLEFLYRVYASTRQDEMALMPWGDDEKNAFLRSQFQFQQQHYRQSYSDATFAVVMVGDNEIGRLYVQRNEDEILVIDIALLPEHRGKGIGGRILQDLLQEASETGKPVGIHVLKANGSAISFYQRLGFEKVEDVGLYDRMEWRADS